MLGIGWLQGKTTSFKGIKSFYDEIEHVNDKKLCARGTYAIDTADIVGSVARAAELDDKFLPKNQGWTQRHDDMERRFRQGYPMNPIKVFKIQHEDHPEYYVVDGHHRVALAKRFGYADINADVTELCGDIQELQTDT